MEENRHKTENKGKKNKLTDLDIKEHLSAWPYEIKKYKVNIMKELLRSFRLKGSRANKVNRSSIVNDDLVEAVNSEVLNINQSTCTDVIMDDASTHNAILPNDTEPQEKERGQSCTRDLSPVRPPTDNVENISQNLEHLHVNDQSEKDSPTDLPAINSSLSYCTVGRKFSLDNNLLSPRKIWSQSEEDLHSIGKLPLERKSSFFRKRLEKFINNTSVVFKQQNLHSIGKRSGSMSVSSQSLNSYKECKKEISPESSEESISALSLCSLVEGIDSSQASLPSQFKDEIGASTKSLTDGYKPDTINCNYRAISFNSGLDNVQAYKNKAKRAKRVTWLGSDSVASYLKKAPEPDTLSYIPNKAPSRWRSWTFTRSDSQGRRRSYQRAVSGEDPVRHRIRKRLSEIRPELVSALAQLAEDGVPPLKNLVLPPIDEHVWAQIDWVADNPNKLELSCKLTSFNHEVQGQQNVLREFLATEAFHIKYLQTSVELFLAAAVDLKSRGFLEEVDLDLLFSNLVEVYFASVLFWDDTISPMITEAFIKGTPFQVQLMCAGFSHFSETLAPYEKYMRNQARAVEYYRSLSADAEFMTYLSWCHSHRLCQRLQLSDMLVKPMQRLTKYDMLINRIAHHSAEPDIPCLTAMEMQAKCYLAEVNRSVRHLEEMDKFERMLLTVQNYSVDFRDEGLNRKFEKHNYLNLRSPMFGCHHSFSRHLVFEGNLYFKDNARETRSGFGIEVRLFLLSDMLLVTKKKSSSQGLVSHKMIRPKFPLPRLEISVQYRKTANLKSDAKSDTAKDGEAEGTEKQREIDRLIVLLKDEVGSSVTCFALSDPKDGSDSLKAWEMKFKEAKLAYDIISNAKNPDKPDIDGETYSDATSRAPHKHLSADDVSIHKDAIERVAVMNFKHRGSSTEHDISQASITTDSMDGESASGRTSRMRTVCSPPPPFANPQPMQQAHLAHPSAQHPLPRPPSETSSRNSRVSSFQQSASATSHDDGPLHICPAEIPQREIPNDLPWQSFIFQMPFAQNKAYEVHSYARSFEEGRRSPMVIRISSDNDNDNSYTLRGDSNSLSSRTLSPSPNNSVRCLRVQAPENTMVLSLPNLLNEPSTSRSRDPERKRKSAPPSRPHSAHLLSPDRRGTTYPPPSPTNRGALKRGLAFSHSVKNRLTKMGHVSSQSQLTVDGTLTHQNSTIGKIGRGGSFPNPTVPPIFTPNEISSNPPIAGKSKSVDNVPQSYPEPSTSSLVTTGKPTEQTRSDSGLRKRGSGSSIRKFIDIYEKFTKK